MASPWASSPTPTSPPSTRRAARSACAPTASCRSSTTPPGSGRGSGGIAPAYLGTFAAFLAAWGPVDQGIGSGQGVKCYHSEHLYGEFWHRAFTVAADVPRCDFVLSFGYNGDASGGVPGVWRHAEARIRGLRWVQLEPHLSVTGAGATEWVPIRPKTDAAVLFALLHVILREHDWRTAGDVE